MEHVIVEVTYSQILYLFKSRFLEYKKMLKLETDVCVREILHCKFCVFIFKREIENKKRIKYLIKILFLGKSMSANITQLMHIFIFSNF